MSVCSEQHEVIRLVGVGCSYSDCGTSRSMREITRQHWYDSAAVRSSSRCAVRLITTRRRVPHRRRRRRHGVQRLSVQLAVRYR